MYNSNINSVSPTLPDEDSGDREPSLAADLAWEYSRKLRRAENVSIKDFHARLHDQASRDEFDFLTGMDEFLVRTGEYQVENCNSSTNE